MDARLLHPSLSRNHSYLIRPHLFSPSPARLRLGPQLFRATGGPAASNDNEVTDMGDKINGNTADNNAAAPASPPPQPRPATLNIKNRPRSRNQARRQEEQQRSPRKPPPKKDWESMTLGEKGVELYAGEKGLLFWLNKFAYASIFIIAGGWILFRFVGPSLGLYQLDSAPLSPSSLFKGS